MQITELETIHFDQESTLTDTERDIEISLVRVHTDHGIIGLGETYPQREMEVEAIHGPIAQTVLGRDPRNVEGIRDDLLNYFNYYGHAGAEHRALSALDIALWDIKGQLAGQPIYQLLGGKARKNVPTYNTCYDSTYDFREQPVELAQSLLDQDIDSMKIWPFDSFAKETRGHRISTTALKRGLEPIRLIREAFGDDLEIAVEFHGLWSVSAGKRLVDAVSEYDPIWVEDVIRKGNFEAYRQLGTETDVPLCISERLMGRHEFLRAFQTGAVDIAMPDICWTGGLTEAKVIASLAETYHLPVAPHNAGGPVLHFATAHLAASIPNLFIMETIRDRYDGWHRNLVTDALSVNDGTIEPPEKPGLGTEFDSSLLNDERTQTRTSTL